MCQAWGNPSSSHPAGRKAKELIGSARESLARMLGGRPEDIVFTSGGTEANNMVIHTACRHFHESQYGTGDRRGTPHIVTSSVEHDSIRLLLEQLGREGLAEATFVPVSPRSGQAEVDDVLAAIRPNTCLVSLMLANNETGVIMPVAELSQRISALNQHRAAEGLPRILVHTDAAQMIGKGRVDVQELGVDYLTIVGHKFHGPRIGALYARSPGTATPLHPMLFGGGQERSFRPGTENTPMIAGLGQAAELVNKNWEAYEAHMRDVRDYLEATLEVSTSGPFLQSQAAGCGAWSRVGVCLWPCLIHHKDRAAWKPREVHSPSDFSRPPLGSRGFASTVTLRAPRDSATPVTSPSWAQAFKVALTLQLSCDGYTQPSTCPSQHLWLRLAGAWCGSGREVRQE
uniref:Selenocysteine lyase n=1 Tax=Cyanistes caeruleus TaxID=156563 RepID=A0A8C0VEL9_CYACU